MVGTHKWDFGVVNELISPKILKMSVDLGAVIQSRNTDLALQMSEICIILMSQKNVFYVSLYQGVFMRMLLQHLVQCNLKSYSNLEKQ